MKVLSITPGHFETVIMQAKPPEAGHYRRDPNGTWWYLIARDGGEWLMLYDPRAQEIAYQEFKQQGRADERKRCQCDTRQ